MPYIIRDRREDIFVNKAAFPKAELDECIVVNEISCAGELQYAMAVMFKSYIEQKGITYQVCNDIMGALAGAQMEFYRRHVVPYEDRKIKINGDV